MRYFTYIFPKTIILFIFILSTLTACKQEEKRFIPDISHIKSELKIHRFDKALFAVDTNNYKEGLDKLHQDFPEFSPFFFEQILQIKAPNDSIKMFYPMVNGFLRFKPLQKLNDTCQLIYKDFLTESRELERAFRYCKYYLPEYKTPQVYTLISDYALVQGIAPDGSLLIGLDMFLGPEYPVYNYPPLNVPRYIARTRNQEHLPAQAMMAITDDLVGPPAGRRLLDLMINNGKKLYLLDIFMPHTPDSIKLSYTSYQTEFVYENETNLWYHFVDEELLYSNKLRDFQKHITPSPNAPKMPVNAPGNTASWLGMRIIQHFMKNNPEVSVKQLLEMHDAQEILTRSRYKPPRQ